MLWHKDKWVAPAMEAFQELIQQKLEDAEVATAGLALEGSLAR